MRILRAMRRTVRIRVEQEVVLPRRAAKPLAEPTCPSCGGPILYDLTCHTYQQGGRWCACLPCDSAVEYSCASDEDESGCDWSYVHGLNPRNPRAVAMEKRRPEWLPADAPSDMAVVGVRWCFDHDDD